MGSMGFWLGFLTFGASVFRHFIVPFPLLHLVLETVFTCTMMGLPILVRRGYSTRLCTAILVISFTGVAVAAGFFNGGIRAPAVVILALSPLVGFFCAGQFGARLALALAVGASVLLFFAEKQGFTSPLQMPQQYSHYKLIILSAATAASYAIGAAYEKSRHATEKLLKDLSVQSVQISKLISLGEMAAGMAHEMNQPLSGISLAVDIIKKLKGRNALSDEELESSLRDIKASVDRCAKVIQHVRTFARQDTPEYAPLEINETIESALMLLGEQFRLGSIEIEKDLCMELPKVNGDPFRLEQVWINLLTNSRDALDQRENENIKSKPENFEKYRKQLAIRSRLDDGQVVVEICDNGVGMSDKVLKKIFELFFTTKPVGKGTGLGMSIAHGILDLHKATIGIKSEPNKGTTILIRLAPSS